MYVCRAGTHCTQHISHLREREGKVDDRRTHPTHGREKKVAFIHPSIHSIIGWGVRRTNNNTHSLPAAIHPSIHPSHFVPKRLALTA
mmetsp:Transcript_48588/g.121617  ORF Transcript_48588/g.121617 Transcript_48588/m.121617 type:complete len:87 (-) Transcript_48588:1439-1699(-)